MDWPVILSIASGVVLIACFKAAYLLRNHKGWSADKQEIVGNLIGVVLAFAMLVFVESLLQHFLGTSFYCLWATGSTLPFTVFLAGAVLGIVYEYYGQYAFTCWEYPAIERRRWMMLLTPVFWGMFMLIMQDVWALLQQAGVNDVWSVIITSLSVFGVLEGFNLLTHSWIYKGRANTPYALVAGWIILTLTFVVGYNHFFTSPFGF